MPIDFFDVVVVALEAVVELEGIDLVWAGAPRADGERSLELFVRR